MIEPLLPPGLTLDTFDGKAYVGLVPFTMHGIRPSRYLPPMPGVSAFHETNVRTYVHSRGQGPGVWFFSLDAANPVAVTAARVGWHLPYFFARMSLDQQEDRIHYTSRRLYPPPKPADLDITWRIGRELGSAKPDSFEHFLCERYLLYATQRDGTLLSGQVHHTPYPLHEATVESIQDSVLAAAGFPVEGPPVSALYSPGVDVEVFDLIPA